MTIATVIVEVVSLIIPAIRKWLRSRKTRKAHKRLVKRISLAPWAPHGVRLDEEQKRALDK